MVAGGEGEGREQMNRKKKRMRREKGGQGRKVKIAFWNVRGLKNKDREFWR